MNENVSSVTLGSVAKSTNVVSPKLQRISHTRKRKNDEEFTMQDFFKFQMMERAEAREQERLRREEAREQERSRREEEREERKRREASDRIFQNLLLATMMNMNGNHSKAPTSIFHMICSIIK